MSKSYVFDVELIVKERWRVQLTADKLPTKRKILEMLQENEQDDVIDDETLEVQSIESVELLPQDDDEEIDDSDDEEEDDES